MFVQYLSVVMPWDRHSGERGRISSVGLMDRHRRQSAEKKNMSRTDSTDDSGKPEIAHHYDNSMRLREGK